MSSLVAKIKDIEDEMARTQINKQTMAHICGLRAKLAKYKRELLFDGPKSGAQGAGEGFDVKATGDARVGLVGFPSVGKSTLLTSLTGISSADRTRARALTLTLTLSHSHARLSLRLTLTRHLLRGGVVRVHHPHVHPRHDPPQGSLRVRVWVSRIRVKVS